MVLPPYPAPNPTPQGEVISRFGPQQSPLSFEGEIAAALDALPVEAAA